MENAIEGWQMPVWSKGIHTTRKRGHLWAIYLCYVTDTPHKYYTIVQVPVGDIGSHTKWSASRDALVDECNEMNKQLLES